MCLHLQYIITNNIWQLTINIEDIVSQVTYIQIRSLFTWSRFFLVTSSCIKIIKISIKE